MESNVLLDEWKEFENASVPLDFGSEQRRTAMFAYYASAAAIAARLPAEDEFTKRLQTECHEFSQSLAESFPP